MIADWVKNARDFDLAGALKVGNDQLKPSKRSDSKNRIRQQKKHAEWSRLVGS